MASAAAAVDDQLDRLRRRLRLQAVEVEQLRDDRLGHLVVDAA